MTPRGDARALVDRLTEILGPPLRDRERGLDRWRCPVCGGGFDDPLRLYRPLIVSDQGWIVCEASLRRGYIDDESCNFTPERLRTALRSLSRGGEHG